MRSTADRPGPDFLVIGAMKAATSTLHEQLRRQCGVFMTTPKEPCFFSDDEVYARGIDWYRGLFDEAPPGSLRGESSTHYTKLPTYPATAERIRRHLGPSVRLVYVVRHPIDRLVSQYVHEWTMRQVEGPLEEALERRPELVDYSRYGMQLGPYVERFGTGAILPVVFERLCADPQPELERICRFIGGPPAPRWDAGLVPQNVSRERVRRSPLRDAILALPGMAAVRRVLVPRRLRDRVKARWMMAQRPQLPAARAARLRALFDEDLAHLRGWFGLELSCAAFEALKARPARAEARA